MIVPNQPPVGADHVSVTNVSPRLAARLTGAGAFSGVPVTVAKLPSPYWVIVVTRNWYDTPFVSPVTVAPGVALAPSANVVHVDPLFPLTSTL